MSPASQVWEEMVAVALVGTERQRLPALAGEERLGELLARLEVTDAPEALLGAASVVGAYRRAGWLPAVDARPAPEPSAPERTPPCPPRAARRLWKLVTGDRREFLPEWLQAAAGAGVHIPAAALPELMEMARARPELWELLAPVAGERGRWLATLNPDWSALLAGEADAESVWTTGSRTERLALLQRLRAADPDAARERVASTWATDPPEERARFVAAFETGLSMADEPFLEAALDDRRKEVRQVAADLLARLPESGLCRRMVERLRPLLTLRRGLRGETIQVQLPEACDRAMIRDGIEPDPRRESMGEKSSWVTQMLAAAPPATWEATWQQPPAALIARARGEWQAVLMTGWSHAARRHQDLNWAEAFLRVWIASGRPCEFPPGLFAVLPAERRERVVLERLREEGDGIGLGTAELLRNCTHAWSPELTCAAMDALRRYAAAGAGVADGEVRELLREAVYFVPPALGPEVAMGWDATRSHWGVLEIEIGNFLERMRFRHEMLKEFE